MEKKQTEKMQIANIMKRGDLTKDIKSMKIREYSKHLYFGEFDDLYGTNFSSDII